MKNYFDLYSFCENRKNMKSIAFLFFFEYTERNRVTRNLFDIGDQAETCAQLFFVKENFYGLKNVDL